MGSGRTEAYLCQLRGLISATECVQTTASHVSTAGTRGDPGREGCAVPVDTAKHALGCKMPGRSHHARHTVYTGGRWEGSLPEYLHAELSVSEAVCKLLFSLVSSG